MQALEFSEQFPRLTVTDIRHKGYKVKPLLFRRVVCGSIFRLSARVCRMLHWLAIMKRVPSGSNSAVECDLAKVEVAGSNPVSRSRKSLYLSTT